MVPRDRPALPVHRAPKETPAIKVPLVPSGSLVQSAQPGRLDQQVPRDFKDHRALTAHPVRPVLKARLGPQGRRDPSVKRDLKDRPARRAPSDLRGHRVLSVPRDQSAPPARLDH